MIDFKTIELSDKKYIDECFVENTFRSCDFNFTNLYAWRAKFKTQFAIVNKTIFVKFIDEGAYYYLFPMGKMPVEKAFDLLKLDAEKNNIPLRLKGVSSGMFEEIEAIMPKRFEYIPNRANDEYIYLSEKLITLSGKKLQSKRNHINRFKADNPDWEYVSLESEAIIGECIAMLDEWEVNNGIKTDCSLRFDYIATETMLKEFDYMQLRGGAIKVNGRIIAFSIGEPLSEDTFVVHVEKAFGEINGAYTIINQQFVLHAASEFKYINREEDLGIENLRKAKMSYYPDILLQEGILIPKSK